MCHYRPIYYPECSGNRGCVKPKKRFNPTTSIQEQGIGEIAPIYGNKRFDTQSKNTNEKDIHKTT